MRTSRFVLLFVFCFSAILRSQSPLVATYRVETTYPSMTERHVVKLVVDDWSGIWAGHGAAPDVLRWPWTDPRRYYIRRENGERIPVQRVDVPGFFASSSAVTLLYLILDPEVRVKDKEALVVLLLRNGLPSDVANAPASNAFQAGNLQRYNLGLTPAYVPNQQLVTGNKRNVGQVETKLDFHQLYTLGNRARGYLTIDNILSTDSNDKASQVQALWGVFERSLVSSWYIPIHLETKISGDQTVRYSSSVTSLGLRSLIPWRFTKPVLYNGFLQAPVSPVFQFDGQFERRIPRTDEMKRRFPELNQPRLQGQMSWAPLRLLPASGSETISLEIAAKGWYLPSDRNSLNQPIQRLEGQLQVSLLVPLANFSLEGLNFVTDAKDKAKQRIRLTYSIGANEAQGFSHSHQLTLGMELTK